MNSRAPLPAAQLLVYQFGADARFEGQLGGALERFEGQGPIRILEVLFIRRESDTQELVAVDLSGGGAGGLIAPLLDFRLDPEGRRRATERALESGGPGIPGETLRELGSALAPGEAMAALLVEHAWTEALYDAVDRTGGTPLVSEFVEPRTLAELTENLLRAAGRGDRTSEAH